MKYTVAVVPPGGGETDWNFTVSDASYVPRVGEYIVVAVDSDDEEHRGIEAYFVRYIAVSLQRKDGASTTSDEPVLHAERVRHPYQSVAHAAACEREDGHWGNATQDFPNSGY